MDKPAIKGWNHSPEVPLKTSPLFAWPPRPVAALRWVWDSWFLLSERLIIVGIAFATWHWLQPPLETMREFSLDWILPMYIRNLALMTLVAGGLHLWLHAWSRQGKRLRFDARPLAERGRQFTLGGQVRDNMFWTLVSGVGFWTAYEAVMLWAMANGFAPTLSWAANPVWFVALFLLIPIWESFYFYWTHRLLHVPFLYRRVHAVHHRNVNVGPWSGLSMHPVEHALYLASVFVHLVVAAHPVHVLYHLQYYCLTAATTHCGFEGLWMRDRNRLALGTFHHQMHHRYFECNYGGLEMPWDRWFGSFHDGTPEAHGRMRDRRGGIAED